MYLYKVPLPPRLSTAGLIACRSLQAMLQTAMELVYAKLNKLLTT